MTADIRTAAEDEMIRANAVEPLVVVDGEEAVMQLTEYGNGFIAGAVWAAARALEEAAQTYPFTLLGVGTTWHEAQKVLCERAAEIRGAKRDAARQEAGA